jgi:hypothetical protein
MIFETMIAATAGWTFALPPPRYDRQYGGVVEIYWAGGQNIRQYCPEHGVACVKHRSPEHCLIVFNVRWMHYYSAIMRHELAHCNGWPSDHPQ